LHIFAFQVRNLHFLVEMAEFGVFAGALEAQSGRLEHEKRKPL
jgi:hypothetical protein